jgi:hypothetical protein
MKQMGIRLLLDLAIVEHSGKHAALPIAFMMHPRVVDALYAEIGPHLRVTDKRGRAYYNGVELIGDPLAKFPRLIAADWEESLL